MVEEKTSKKKQLVLMGVGLAFLLVLVIGATYAYFTFASQNDFKDPATIEGSMGELGAGVSLTKAEDSTLTLNLSAADMLLENAQTYYASGSEEPKTIATVKVAGAGYYNCTYTLEVSKTATSPETDMYERFINSDIQDYNQIYLMINDTKYDFYEWVFDWYGTDSLFHSEELKYISSDEDINITANLIIVNSESINQTDLNGTDISISIKATEFDCTLLDDSAMATVNSVTNTSDSVDSLTVKVNATDVYGIDSYTFSIDGESEVTQKSNTYTFEGLESNTEYEISTKVNNVIGNTTESKTIFRTGKTIADACPGNSMSDCLKNASETGLQKNIYNRDDLYRFVGNDGNTGINNYICLGAETCTSGDNNMYRIIGVNPETNELKVIKETEYSTSRRWHNSQTDGVTWEESNLYSTLNTSWLNSISFGDLIVAKTWNIGDVDWSPTSKGGVVFDENRTQSTTLAKVGALSMSDYYLAHTADRNWNNNSDNTNWLLLDNNTSTYNSFEWTMSREETGYAYAVVTGGTVQTMNMTGSHAVRPTFFLTSELQYVSGTGESTNPFIVQANTSA